MGNTQNKCLRVKVEKMAVAIEGDEFGIAQMCEVDLGPVPEEPGRQMDFEYEIESGPVAQRVSVAVLAAFHTTATLQVFPTVSSIATILRRKRKLPTRNHMDAKKLTLLSPVELL